MLWTGHVPIHFNVDAMIQTQQWRARERSGSGEHVLPGLAFDAGLDTLFPLHPPAREQSLLAYTTLFLPPHCEAQATQAFRFTTHNRSLLVSAHFLLVHRQKNSIATPGS